MEFFDKLGKKASEAYRVTADKTGKIAKETKLKIKMGDLKSKINDIYEEIGKIVYEKHVKKEEIDIEKDLIEQCTNIDVMSDEIEALLKECLELKDKKQCSKCFTEIEKDAKFCPHCGMRQEENRTETQEENQNEVHKENEVNSDEKETNLEKTTIIEINPTPENITEEEVKNIGADENEPNKEIKDEKE